MQTREIKHEINNYNPNQNISFKILDQSTYKVQIKILKI